MTTARSHTWDYLYAAVLLIAIPVALFHFVQERYPQALIALGASIAGFVLLYIGWSEPEAEEELEEHRSRTPLRLRHATRPAPRDRGRLADWAPIGLVSGFVATGVMTVAILIAYAAAAALGSMLSSSSTLALWFNGLVDNTITDVTMLNLPLAIIVHMLAGLGWALIYTGVVEPRLSGPGWLAGMKFAIIPYILSIVVLFPLAGGGILGFGLEAGPLPLIGNLIVHLVYGAALGELVLSQAFYSESGEPEDDEQLYRLAGAQRTMAMALLPGIVVGGLLGLVGSGLVAPDADPLMVSAVGAILGSVTGVLIGSFLGLSPEQASKQRGSEA